MLAKEHSQFVVEVGTEDGWVPRFVCDTVAVAESKFEDYAGDGHLVRIMGPLRRTVWKQGGGPQGYSPHPDLLSVCRDVYKEMCRWPDQEGPLKRRLQEAIEKAAGPESDLKRPPE